MVTDELISRLSTVNPEIQIDSGIMSKHPLGNNGMVAVYPQTEAEIAGVLKFANDNVKKVAVIGGGTKRGFGGSEEESADILLSMANFKGVVEHTIGDMTLTIKAGTPFKEVQDFLEGCNQKIPLDPYTPKYATIGGVVAANDSGPKRLGYGSARDAVIGMRVVYPDGTVIRTGGKTVKNVAGYDFNKLFIGSMGTLGVISEITFKLRPLQKYENLVFITFPDGSLEEVYAFTVRLLDTIMEPISLELFSPALAEKLTGRSCYTLAVSFEDVESAVKYQVELVESLKPIKSIVTVKESKDAQEFWSAVANLPPSGVEDAMEQGIRASVKLGVKNLDVIKVIKQTQLLQDTHHLLAESHGGLGHGIVRVYLTGAGDDVVSAIKALRAIAEAFGGNAVVTHLPFDLRQQIDVWGKKTAYFFLFEGIKSKIDPKRILNPKRFVGGI
ncbi:FAD-binding oxidoreductase [Neobacillus muris]|uniref:FAD-binding oxidoreductase n=1 Tax=Neobacillus muris TaxID=2941334 RepID=UPI0020417D1F|nr:FAD-binding oxidoreductase [Neobacillus muris]